jgi:hypothetical protein
VYDTTVVTANGNYHSIFKFPKFHPDSGLLVCVKICLKMTSVVSMYLENNASSPQTYNINYTRQDTLTGTGLNPALTNQISVNYGPYNLAASDGIPLWGPDFVSIGPDTVLNAVTVCRTLTDSVDLVPFYGYDSLTYNYSIHAGATVTGSGDYLFSVSSHGIVNLRLQYCYCPTFSLPLNIRWFEVKKNAADQAELKWDGFDDPNTNYHYEVEVSRNGLNFSSIGSMQKHTNASSGPYRFLYTTNNAGGLFYFRIKQVYSNGYTRFSEIRSVTLENTGSKIIIFPNPSKGVVGIKFDKFSSGKFWIQIFSAQGQKVFNKEFEGDGNTYRQITMLQQGMYWLRLIDVTNHQSCVSQLLIK